MSSITQRIPNFLLGISQQPDNRKFPGQLRDAVNTLPDYALGLLKRPGGKHIAELHNATPSGKWFSILRDEQEKYVAQYANNTFRVWSLIDSVFGPAGSPRPVDMGIYAGVPASCNLTNLRADLSAYNAAVADKDIKLGLLNDAQATYAEVLAGQDPTLEELFEVDYNYPVGEIDQYLKSGILQNINGVYTVKNNNAVVNVGTTLPAGYSLGVEVTDEHPLLASEGFRIYKANRTVAAAYNASDLATALAAMNAAQTNYNTSVSAVTSFRALYDAEVAQCGIGTPAATHYLSGATPDDIELLTLNDYTFVLNKAKTVQMTAATSPAKINEAFVVVKVVGTGHYRITLDGNVAGTYNAGTGGDVDAIISDLVSDINGNTFGGKIYTARAVGPGIYISATASFTIEVVGGPSENALFVFQDTVATVADLPVSCKEDYLVKVTNSAEVDVDDMWVKFVTDSGATYGSGSWVETTAPGIQYELNPLTMPHQLVRQADGTFRFDPVNWEDRLVGDNETNPIPSFVGQKINNIFFYRNRLGFLSNEAVILSRAGEYFNFWSTTALTVTDNDPIDITAASIRPVNHRYVRPTSVGLILFSDTEQFLLTTDADILSPKTAKINELSSYECDPVVEAVNLGTSVAFVSKTPLFTRLFELSGISPDRPPEMSEQTKIVPELIPQTITSLIASPASGTVSLGTAGSSTVYQYRFLAQGPNQRLSSWYKWQLTGTLLDQFFDNNLYYAVVASGYNVAVQSYDLTQQSEEGFLTLPTGEKTDVCLDFWNVNPYRTYNSSDDTTRIFLPYERVVGKTMAVVILGNYIGDNTDTGSESIGSVLYPVVDGGPGNYYFDIDGDYRGRDLIIGYTYAMEVAMPKFFVTSSDGNSTVSDFTSDLIIHRIKVSTGLSGPITYRMEITGRPTWDKTIEGVLPYIYDLNNVNMAAETIHEIPIYQRNSNLSFTILGASPFPINLLSLNWEGRYNTGFYRRS